MGSSLYLVLTAFFGDNSWGEFVVDGEPLWVTPGVESSQRMSIEGWRH